MNNVPRPDHVEAAIELLLRQIARLRDGVPREEVGRDVTLIGRILERRT